MPKPRTKRASTLMMLASVAGFLSACGTPEERARARAEFYRSEMAAIDKRERRIIYLHDARTNLCFVKSGLSVVQIACTPEAIRLAKEPSRVP
jgi:hypothetical protein